jgi:hypothetical protein
MEFCSLNIYILIGISAVSLLLKVSYLFLIQSADTHKWQDTVSNLKKPIQVSNQVCRVPCKSPEKKTPK